MNQLPAHLQGRQVRNLTERAAEGMGSSLPPHISIQGNSFTFIDAAGKEADPMSTFDAAIIDISDHMNKRYYDKPFDPNASTYEPPVCWSANGLAPSREASKPQSDTCEMCPQNMRGSAVSKISGASIKACRDEKWIALLNVAWPQYIFQLVITPGSFTNWKAFVKKVEDAKIEMSLLTVRISFQPKTNGVLVFEPVDYVTAQVADAVEMAIKERKTDVLVGRTDQPRLPTGKPQQTLNAPAQEVLTPEANLPFGQVGSPAAFAGNQPMQGEQGSATANLTAQIASPSEAQPARRRRRTAAEMAEANAAPAGQPTTRNPGPATFAGQPTSAAPAAPFGNAAAPGASFGNPAPAAAAGAPGHDFGISEGAPANPEVSAMLAGLFKKG